MTNQTVHSYLSTQVEFNPDTNKWRYVIHDAAKTVFFTSAWQYGYDSTAYWTGEKHRQAMTLSPRTKKDEPE